MRAVLRPLTSYMYQCGLDRFSMLDRRPSASSLEDLNEINVFRFVLRLDLYLL